MDVQTYSDILELLHREVKPALGCTEPIAVALAVAKACSLFRSVQPSQINVQVSANILKNAMGVGIPGTGMVGLNIAVALAMECGNPDYGLEVLKDLSPADVERAKAYAAEGRVKISLAKTSKKLYIEAECLYGPVEVPEHRSRAVIQDDHDAIVFVSKDDEVLLNKMNTENQADAGNGPDAVSHKTTLDYHLDMRKIFDFATREACLEDISFLLETQRSTDEPRSCRGGSGPSLRPSGRTHDPEQYSPSGLRQGAVDPLHGHDSGSFRCPYGRMYPARHEQFRQR